jgi:diguanylate cyclase (GGDEF)-like protein
MSTTVRLPGIRLPRKLLRAWKRLVHGEIEDRIVHLVVALLLAVQLASFLCMRYAIHHMAQRSVSEELQVGSRVLDRLLLIQGQQLSEAANVLAADFGFREAVASEDRMTILSALENHAARFKASRMTLVGVDGRVIADSANPASAGRRFGHPDLMARHAAMSRGPTIRIVEGNPHQMVAIPVRTPLTSAWLVMMLAIDDATARDLERLVNAGVAFVVQEGSSVRVVATTLGEANHMALASPIVEMVRDQRPEGRAEGADASYQMLTRHLDVPGGQRIHAVLMRSTEDSIVPYRTLEMIAMMLTAAAIALTLFGAMRIAKRISGPIRKLDAYGQQGRELMRARLSQVREQRDDLALVTRDLAAQVTRDPLTGLTSRRTLELQLAGWDAEERTIAAVVATVDNLELIRDSYSTTARDQVLVAMAGLVRGCCRPADIPARYGDDRFLIAIANPEPDSASAVATRLLASVRAHPWHQIGVRLRVNASVSVVEASRYCEPSDTVRRAAEMRPTQHARSSVLTASFDHLA